MARCRHHPVDGGRSVGQRPTHQVAFISEGQAEVQNRLLSAPTPTEIQIATRRTLISAGTELDYLNGLIPGRLRPEVTFPVYPGYSNVGRVAAVGSDVTGIELGERVLTMGPHASHHNVEVATAIRVPDTVPDDAATFAVLGSVALHGVRRAPPELGDSVLVVGDGLVGQLTAQLAALQGARPVALAGHHRLRLAAARQGGVAAAWDEREANLPTVFLQLTAGRLADIVYETAGQVAALELAFKTARVAGTVVLLGGIRQPLSMEPPVFYLQFLMRDLTLMAAAQPVRPALESNYFHWTKQRNRELILNLLAEGALQVEHLVTQTFPASEAPQAYELLSGSKEKSLGVLLDWM